MRSSNIGGQAVLEGVMMKNGEDYAVAVRKPDGEIEVKTEKYSGAIKCKNLKKIPFVRGIFSFIDSMVLGMKTLTYSASFYEEEEEKKELTPEEKEKEEKKESFVMGLTITFSIILAVAVFMILPYLLTHFLAGMVHSKMMLSLLEGVIRLTIFIAYILLISTMKDIKRVFMYHGAEHKCINCVEHGLDLTVENVRISSKQHKRCGTSLKVNINYGNIYLITFFVLINELFLYHLKQGNVSRY